MDRRELDKALTRLGQLLRERRVASEVAVFGGAAIVLGFVDLTPMNGSDILAAIREHVEINGGGQGAQRMQSPDPAKLLKRMSKDERLAFAADGSLPDWSSRARAATPFDSQEGDKGCEVTDTKGSQ